MNHPDQKKRVIKKKGPNSNISDGFATGQKQKPLFNSLIIVTASALASTVLLFFFFFFCNLFFFFFFEEAREGARVCARTYTRVYMRASECVNSTCFQLKTYTYLSRHGRHISRNRVELRYQHMLAPKEPPARLAQGKRVSIRHTAVTSKQGHSLRYTKFKSAFICPCFKTGVDTYMLGI